MKEPKHPLGILRRTIGLQQKEMAALLERSLALIHQIEYGRKKISPELAWLAAYKTGVSSFWLRTGFGPIQDSEGKRYTRETYEHHKSVFFAGPPRDPVRLEHDLLVARSLFLHMIERLGILFNKAFQQNDLWMCHYNLCSATSGVLEKSGVNKKLTEDEKARWYHWIWAKKKPQDDKEPLGGYSYLQWIAQSLDQCVGGPEMIYAMEAFTKQTEAVFEEKLKRLPRTAEVREYIAKREAPPPKREPIVPELSDLME